MLLRIDIEQFEDILDMFKDITKGDLMTWMKNEMMQIEMERRTRKLSKHRSRNSSMIYQLVFFVALMVFAFGYI